MEKSERERARVGVSESRRSHPSFAQISVVKARLTQGLMGFDL